MNVRSRIRQNENKDGDSIPIDDDSGSDDESEIFVKTVEINEIDDGSSEMIVVDTETDEINHRHHSILQRKCLIILLAAFVVLLVFIVSLSLLYMIFNLLIITLEYSYFLSCTKSADIEYAVPICQILQDPVPVISYMMYEDVKTYFMSATIKYGNYGFIDVENHPVTEEAHLRLQEKASNDNIVLITVKSIYEEPVSAHIYNMYNLLPCHLLVPMNEQIPTPPAEYFIKVRQCKISGY